MYLSNMLAIQMEVIKVGLANHAIEIVWLRGSIRGKRGVNSAILERDAPT